MSAIINTDIRAYSWDGLTTVVAGGIKKSFSGSSVNDKIKEAMEQRYNVLAQANYVSNEHTKLAANSKSGHSRKLELAIMKMNFMSAVAKETNEYLLQIIGERDLPVGGAFELASDGISDSIVIGNPLYLLLKGEGPLVFEGSDKRYLKPILATTPVRKVDADIGL